MNKKNFLTLFALGVLTCSNLNAQSFELFTPADLNTFNGLNLGDGDTFNGTSNIGSLFGLPATDVTLTIANGNIANGVWTVGENNSTTFVLGGPVAVEAFVNHGANLGSPSFASGLSGTASDGVTAAAGESFTLTSALDALNYEQSQNGNDFLVSFNGVDTGNISVNQPNGNQTGFRFASDQAVSQYTVFSTNTSFADLNDNFTTGFRVVAIPEPSSAMLVGLTSGLFFLRRKRS